MTKPFYFICIGGNKKKFKRGSYRGRGGRGRGFNGLSGSNDQYHNNNYAVNGQAYNRSTTTQDEVDTGYDSAHNPLGRWQNRGRGSHRRRGSRGGGVKDHERSNNQYPNEKHAVNHQAYKRTTASQEELDTGYDSAHNFRGRWHNRGRGSHRGKGGRGGGVNDHERSNDQYPNEKHAVNRQTYKRTTASQEELDTGYDSAHNHGPRGRWHNRGRASHHLQGGKGGGLNGHGRSNHQYNDENHAVNLQTYKRNSTSQEELDTGYDSSHYHDLRGRWNNRGREGYRRNCSNARGGHTTQYEAAEDNNKQPTPFKCKFPFIFFLSLLEHKFSKFDLLFDDINKFILSATTYCYPLTFI